MFRSSLLFTLPLTWLRRRARCLPKAVGKRQSNQRPRLTLEALEDRLAPATFSETAGIITLTLDNTNEAVQVQSTSANHYALTSTANFAGSVTSPSSFSGFATTSGTLITSGVSQIRIVDGGFTGASVTFNDSGANPYRESFSVSLTNAAAGTIVFNGASTFSAGLSAATTNNIVVAAGSTATLNGSASSLQATGTSTQVNLNGSLIVTSATLQVSAGADISQGPGATIKTSAGTAAAFTLTGTTGDILLGNIHNDLAGSVTFSQSGGGIVRDVNLRNEDPAAQFPTITGLPIRNFTQFFDNTSIALPAGLSLGGNLNISAGSGISETGPIAATGAGSFTILTNGSIRLDSAGNNIAGSISFSTVRCDNTTTLAYTGMTAVSLGLSTLGLGTVTISALNGNITQAASVTQNRGGGSITLNLAGAGNTVTLSNNPNDFEGPVAITGSATTVTLTNVSTLAALPTFPATVTSLALTYTNAPVVLGNLTLATLTVDAQGIFQSAGSAVVVTGNADLQANRNPLVLTNAGNDFTNIRLRNTGPNRVAITDTNTLNFAVGNSVIGSGTFAVTAGGAVTQTANTITQAVNAGLTTFNAGTGSAITLNQSNSFRGVMVFNTTGANGDVSLINGAITLGTSKIGGNLTISNAAMSQQPGSTLTVGGDTIVGVGGQTTTLDNIGNTFLGSVGVTGTNAAVRDSGPLILRACAVTGSLTVHAGGDITQLAGTAITGGATALVDAGTSAITLTEATNDFGVVSVICTGTAAVAITDTNALAVDRLNLGSGNVTLTCTNLSQSASAGGITQTGAANIFSIAVTGSVSLQATANHFLNAVNLPSGAIGLTVVNQGNVSFVGTPALSGAVNLTAGGVLTLPNAPLNVTTFTASARKTIVSQNLTTSAGAFALQFQGAVSLAAGITLNTSASASAQLSFAGDVNPAGALTLNLGATGQVNVDGGTWSQGTGTLTISGGSFFNIGNGSSPATFSMVSGTIAMPNSATINVFPLATFRVGGTSGSDVVTVDNNTGAIIFQNNSTLSVGLGATNDELVKATGDTGNITINIAAHLTSYSGLAGAAASPVLDAAAGTITSFFKLTKDTSNLEHVFLMGTDIVLPHYTANQLTIAQGGTVDADGVVTGFEADSDQFTVKASTGAAAHLVVAQDVNSRIDVVVRNAALATTLTISTTRSFGDGFTALGGIAVDGPGDVSISAATADLFGGDILVGGRLAALALHDFIGDSVAGNIIHGGGTNTQTTTITGREFSDVSIDLLTVLNSLTLNELVDTNNPTNTITAERFGTIKVAALPVAFVPGDFAVAHLTNLNTASSSLAAVGAVTVAASLSGEWDIRGSVGSVTAANTDTWSLGLPDGANVRNGNRLTTVTTLSLGVVTNSNIQASGKVATVTAKSWANGTLQAAGFGIIKTTGDPTQGNFGNFDNMTLTSTSNSGFVALTGLSIAGNSSNVTVQLLDGNATSISVGRQATGWNVTGEVTLHGGSITTLTAGAFTSLVVDARAIGTLAAVGNVAAKLFGDITGSTITLHATPGFSGVVLGTLKATRNLQGSSSIVVENGSITTIAVGRSINNVDIRARGAAGAIGSLTAAEWIAGGGSDNLVARNIGTLSIVGVPLTPTNSAFLPGDFTQVNVLTFLNSGTAPAIGTLSVAGNYTFANNGFLNVNNGITTFKVGRQVQGSGINVVALLNSSTTSDTPGRIASLTAGKWNNVDIAAKTLGTVKVAGFLTPENPSPSLIVGNFTNSDIGLFGASLATHVSLGTVLANIFSGNNLLAPFGITSLVAADILSSSTIDAENPVTETEGRIGLLQAAGFQGDDIRAVSVGTLKTVVNPAGVLGDFNSTDLTVTGFTGTTAAPVAVGAISLAGQMNQSTLNVPRSITSFTVTGGIGAAGGDQIAAGFAAASGVITLSISSMDQSTFTARSIGTFRVIGNTNLEIRGDVTRSLITLTGNAAGVALGTFSATGQVGASTFNVTGGNVTSFVTGAFFSSRLMVGFHMPSPGNIITQPVAADWLSGSPLTLGTFKTTGLFDPTNVPVTASFRDSFVVAQKLGTVAISGLDPAVPATSTSFTFGVAFRLSAGAGPVIKVDGANRAPDFTSGAFDYKGLNG